MYPLIIISRNRKSCVEQIIDFALDQKIISEIILFDMDSKFPPMLEYLTSLKNEKVRVEKVKNIGPRLLWQNSRFIELIKSGGFFLTDGDIELTETSTKVFEELVRVSFKYSGFRKVGCALRIDNLPVNLKKSEAIIASEIDNWSKSRFIAKNTSLAPIDTTLAFYPRYTKNFYHWPAIRLSGEYSVMHRPWYVDYENLSAEESYYIETAEGWGGFGTSSERGKRPEDVNFNDTLLYKFRLFVKLSLWISPKYASLLITKFINSRNNDSLILST